MKQYLITFRSITFAQKGEWAMKRAGIPCVLGRTPRDMEARGCGYCLKVRAEAAPQALNALKAAGAPYRKLYFSREDGGWEEAVL